MDHYPAFLSLLHLPPTSFTTNLVCPFANDLDKATALASNEFFFLLLFSSFFFISVIIITDFDLDLFDFSYLLSDYAIISYSTFSLPVSGPAAFLQAISVLCRRTLMCHAYPLLEVAYFSDERANEGRARERARLEAEGQPIALQRDYVRERLRSGAYCSGVILHTTCKIQNRQQ
eukprot:6180781-Pleurochrysis_carterae.AAC.4